MIWDDNDDIRLIECRNDRREIQHALDECREERRPYVFITNTMNIKPLRRLLVPVSMLVMDVRLFPEEDPPLTRAVTRFTGAVLVTVMVFVPEPVSFSVSEPNPARAAVSGLSDVSAAAFTVFSVELVVSIP